jgi:hypothetical protein
VPTRTLRLVAAASSAALLVFLTGCASSHAPDPEHPRRGPDAPQIGVAYAFDMESHCGIEWAFFGGHWWQTLPVVPEPKSGSREYTGLTSGSMTLVSADSAKFTAPGLTSVVFHPSGQPTTACS